MRRRDFVQSALALGAVSAIPARAQQQKYPAKPIKFVVPFAAGGGGDVVARMLAQRLTERINIRSWSRTRPARAATSAPTSC
jgi:tripartite-type tricarboxylate transporter receptor subunit TctC